MTTPNDPSLIELRKIKIQIDVLERRKLALIKAARAKNYSYQEIANAFGCSKQAIYEWYNGRKKN